MDTNFTTTKSTVECYKMRSTKSSAWADITIDANGNTGRLQIASDYGSWQYYWGACGLSFKDFLISLNLHYVADKFGEGNWFDLDKTISNLKSNINEFTQYDTIDDLKNELLEELKNLEESTGKDEFIHKMWDSPKIMDMADGTPDLATSISPQFQNFWNNIWQDFKEVLKAECLQVA
jgi:hypothetical protein